MYTRKWVKQMGLDNGICVKKNALTKAINLNDTFIDDDYNYNSNEIDITYWRKCWGLRNDIMEYLTTKYNVNDDYYSFNLEVEDIKQIIEILVSWYDKKKWNSESQSIWTWEEIKVNLLISIRNLYYLLEKMEDYPNEFIVYFYDSY